METLNSTAGISGYICETQKSDQRSEGLAGGFSAVIVKASSGPRYVVGCRTKVDESKLVAGTRVALDMTTLTIMRALPREVVHKFHS